MKNTKRIIATVLTAVMMISMLPSSVFAAELDAYDVVEPAVEAVSVPAEEQEIESTVEDISVEDAEEVQGSSEEIETVDAADPEAADVIEDTEAPVVTEEKTTIEAEGKDYVVTVTYDASALLPDDVKVTAEEIKANAKKYDDYCDQALEAVQQENADVEELSFTRLFDIKLVDADGNPLEPASAVDVQIRLKDVETVEESTQIVHFAGEEEIPEVIEPTVESDTVAFATEGFSIYAVIGTGSKARLTVKFFGAKDETTGEYSLIDTMYVKKADQASAATIKEIINDPGAGEVPAGYSFFGWSIGNKDYDTEAGSTIDDVRNYVQAYEIPEGDAGVLEVYAMYVAHYTVKYLSAENVNLKSDTVLVTKVGDSADYIVNMSYPSDSEHNFEGWMPTDHASNITDPEGAEATTLFENGTPIKIKGDVTFSVSYPEGHWLVFHENGKGATFNAARFVKSGEGTSDADLLPMERPGYTFDGWYLGAPSQEGGDPTGARFNFGQAISETTDVYAKWISNETADYTVIIWKESAVELGTYDYAEAVRIEDAPVNQPVAVSKQGSGDNAYAVINGVAYNGDNKGEYKGFHLKEQNPIVPANATVTPEGNTVVNVYYDRTEYTLRFVLSFTFRGRRYDAIEYDSITAKYGTYIGDQFPISGSLFEKAVSWIPFIGPYLSSYINGFHRWDPQNSATLDKVIVYLETMPAENITFSKNDSITSQINAYYYGEALPGDTPDHEWDGKQWVQIGHSTARYHYFTLKEDWINFTGFDKYKTDPEFDAEGKLDNSDRADFYYTRQSSKITYMNGWAYDGNNARIEAIKGEIAQSDDILFGTNLSSYNKGKDNYFVPGQNKTPKGYVFEGWYVDEYCTKEFEFKTMPAGGITVYAKWREIEYRVFLRPNAGTDNTLTWGSEDQKTNFRVGYGEKISAPYGKRDGYTFLGWYSDEAMTKPVYAANIVVDENTATSAYDKTAQINFTDPNDKLGNANATSNADVGRWWITNKFDLYAKWSKDPIGADGIRVVYNAGEDGTTPPYDTVLYQDNATAVAGGAPKANDGKVFVKWVVQKWDKVNKKFVDTNVERIPGQKFDVKIDDARIQDLDNGEADVDQAVSGGHYIYTIQVIAKYEDAEEKVPTHITWFKNNGSGEFYRNDNNLKINQAVPIYGLGEEGIPERDGYNFIGWAKENEYEEDGTTIRTSSNANEANFLKYENGKFYAKDDAGRDVEVKEVAADEVKPYEALYAIWQHRPHFIIHHSSNGSEQVIYTDEDEPGTTYNLTDYVTKNDNEKFLYGGYYEFVNGERGNAITASGLTLTPEDGKIYYLKEVPEAYLKTQAFVTYRKATPKVLRSMWFLTALDADEDYKGFGFIVNDNDMAAKSGKELEIKDANGTTIETKTASSITKRDPKLEPKAVIVAADASTSYLTPETIGRGIKVKAYYITPDNVKVTGRQGRTFASEDRTRDKFVPGTWEDTYSVEATTAVASRTISARKKLTINSVPEETSFTVTKVDNGKKVAQTVKEGDNTGKITWAGKTNYVFAGWYEDASYCKAADFSNVKQDMTVYAKYVKASTVKLSFAKKTVKAGEVTLKATLKISNQPDIADTAVECTYKDNAYAVEFTGVKKSSATDTYTGTVKISGLENNSAFTAVISYKTPDGTIVNMSSRTCKYNAGTVTVK